MSRQPCRVVVESSAWRDVVAAVSRQPETESGGILLGCRHSTGVYVSEFIEVLDRASTRSSYVRNSAAATKELESRVRELPEEALPGYVGEWHTHPERQGPSRTDRNQIKQISQHSEGEIALVVIVHHPHTAQWSPVVICAKSGRTRQAVIEVQTAGDPSAGQDKLGGPQ